MPVASTPCGEEGEGWPGDKATLPLLLWLCLEKRASSSGLVWQPREAFLLLFADPQHPLPFLCLVSAPGHILWLCPNARLAPSLGARYPHALPPLSTGFGLHFCVLGLAPPLFLGLPVHPSLFVSPGPVEEEPGYFPYD